MLEDVRFWQLVAVAAFAMSLCLFAFVLRLRLDRRRLRSRCQALEEAAARARAERIAADAARVGVRHGSGPPPSITPLSGSTNSSLRLRRGEGGA